jgi:hypothetical protein
MYKLTVKIKNKKNISTNQLQNIFDKIFRTLENNEYFDIIKDQDDNVVGSWEIQLNEEDK